MHISCISLTVGFVLAATTSLAAPIDAISEMSLSHTWLINSGNAPDGITVENLASTLVIDSDIATMIDDPTAEETTSQNFVIGNPFTAPPIAVESEGINYTTVDDNADFASAIYSYRIEIEDDPDDDVFDLTRRDIDQYGFARVNMQENPVDGSAMSSHVGGRDYRFVNTTNNLISFNLTGAFEVDLSATFQGANGIARTSGGFGLVFDVGQGSSVNYFPVAPYLSTTTDTDPGAFVSDLFLANSGGITGISFGASTTATGDGGFTEAVFHADTRYVFGISLDPGASVLMHTSFRQSNSVIVDPATDLAPVPLPASGLMLVFSMLAMFGSRLRKA